MNKITIEELKCIPAKELHELQLTIDNLVKEQLVDESILLAHCDHNVLCCPHCNSHTIIKYGTNKQGKQRYQCKNTNCQHVFISETNTLLFSTKKSKAQWATFIQAYLEQRTLKVCADLAEISEDTAFRWRHKINYLLNKHENKAHLQGVVTLDETLYNVNNKGVVSEVRP